MHEIDFNDVTLFRASWRDHGLSSSKKLERFRSFFRFALDHEWVKENYAKKLRPPQVSQPPTRPFTEDMIKAILAACAIGVRNGRAKGGQRKRCPYACCGTTSSVQRSSDSRCCDPQSGPYYGRKTIPVYGQDRNTCLSATAGLRC